MLKKGTVSINLNPNFVDNNVVLQGTMSSDGFNGKWEWIGFAGKLNGGSFNAVRKKMTSSIRTILFEYKNYFNTL
ncbi:MAG: hypothetical protein M1391_19830 [Bacteroidetes bacterium]|nr:hypothetical protein [Bacteroidota bacterium]